MSESLLSNLRATDSLHAQKKSTEAKTLHVRVYEIAWALMSPGTVISVINITRKERKTK